MYATLFSILVFLFLIFNPYETEVVPDSNMMGITLIIVASLFVLVWNFSLAMAWSPLQKAERDFTPRIMQLFKRDRHVRFINFWLLFFPLLSYVIAIDLMYLNIFDKSIVLAVWIILLGISIDVLIHFLKRILGYLNPFSVISYFVQQATESIQKDDEAELCHWIDALAEMSIKAVLRSSTSLANHSLSQMPTIADNYLKSRKSIAHQGASPDEVSDKVSYVLFYLMQRLELVNNKAVESHLDPVCSHLINVLGKITVHAAEYDVSVMSYPLQYVGKCTKSAQDGGMLAIADHASCTLISVAKTVITDVDITYQELKVPFFTLISQLEEIAKEAFRQDKETSIKYLTQPFLDLKEVMELEQIVKHQDRPMIMQDIDRVLGEFQALDMVMRTVPPIPEVREEETENPES